MFKFNHILQSGISLILLSLLSFSLNAQLSPSEAGYIDAVADYGASNDGVTVTTLELQAAMDAAITEGKGLYLPPGEYLVDGTLNIHPPSADQKFVMQGYSADPAQRSVIVLKAGIYPSYTNNYKESLGFVLQNDYGYDGIGTTTTYERIVQSIDIRLQENNAGAVALNFRGAEGTCAFDMNIDVTGGYAGIYELPGSGGSIADISITGGQVGIDLTHEGGTQPTPVITHLKMQGQTRYGILAHSVRGALTITGADITLNPGTGFYYGTGHGSFAFRFGGNPVINDSRFEYTDPSAENVLFRFSSSSLDLSVNLTNVYVKNATRVVSADHGADQTEPGNASGWRHYEQFNYNSGVWTDEGNSYENAIYLEGVQQHGAILSRHTDVTEVPANLTSVHGWGETFPSFMSEGAVNVRDYEGFVENGDWAPAFNEAIQAAAQTPSNVVFVPTGTYDIYQTIHLGLHTRLIGVSHHHTLILGWDEEGRRFDGSTDAWSDLRPMIKTPDDLNADNILADMAVRMVGPFNNVSHNPEPCVHYAIQWGAGPNSIIRNLNTEPKTSTNYRPVFVMTYQLSKTSWLNLQSITGTIQLQGYDITQDNATQFLNHTPVPAGHWLETVNNSNRLMARSIPEINNHPDTRAEQPNIRIRKSDESPFDLTSIKLAQSTYNPTGGGNIAVDCYNGDVLVFTDTLFLKGLEKPREVMTTLNINQTGITKVILSSPVMFSIDDVQLGDATLDFESLSGATPAVGEGLQSALYYDTGRDLPLSYLNHHIVEITGGVKWYNHRKHGDTWMKPDQAYVYVNNNTAPVNFYHFHAQHSQNDQKLLIENGRDVTVWGIKTENAGYFAKILDSDNIRIFGHGGLTTPPTGTAHYSFKNTTNIGVSSPTDELDKTDYCQYCDGGNAILAQSAVGTYTSLMEIHDEDTLRPDPYHRPILWESGSPEPAYYRSNYESLEPSLKLVYPSDGDVIDVNTTLDLTAIEKTPIDSITAIEFYVDGENIGQSNRTPHQVSYTFESTGDRVISLKAMTVDGVWVQSDNYTVKVSDGFSETLNMDIPAIADVSIENDQNVWDSENLRTRTTDNSVIYLKFPLNEVYGDVIFANLSMYSWGAVAADSMRLVANDSWIDSLVHITPGPGRTILTAEEPAFGSIELTEAGIFQVNITDQVKSENKGGTDSGNDTLSIEIKNEVNTTFSKYSSTESQATAGRDYPPTLKVASSLPLRPEIEIDASLLGPSINEGDIIDFGVKVLTEPQKIVKVEFFVNGELVGLDSSPPFLLNHEMEAVGDILLTAIAYDIAGMKSTAILPKMVIPTIPNIPPNVALTYPVPPATFKEGETLTLTATADDSDGEILAVKFIYYTSSESYVLGVDDRAPYEFVWYNLPAGKYQLKAIAYDNEGASSEFITDVITILSKPEVYLLNPVNDEQFLVGDELHLEASVISKSSIITEVRFYVKGELVNTDAIAPYEYDHTLTEAGTYPVGVEAQDEYEQVSAQYVNITVNQPKGPYGGIPAEIPGYIDAENFDEGGNGISYQDDDLRDGNAPGYRPLETVDIRMNANPLYPDDSLAVGNVQAMEWMEYTVNVSSADTFVFTIEAAGPRPAGEPSGGTYDRGYCALFIDGDSIAAVMITNTHDDEYGPDAWHSWTGFSIPGIILAEGTHVIRWKAFGAYNVNRISLLKETQVGLHPGMPANQQLSVFPNPFREELTFRFELQQSSDVSISLTDAAGRTLDVIHASDLNAGRNEIHWTPRKDEISGLVWYRMTIRSVNGETVELRGQAVKE